MNISILSDEGLPVTRSKHPPHASGSLSGQVQRRWRWRLRQDILGLLDDAALLLLIVLGAPLAILMIGIPVALFVRLLIEIAQRY
jgi:hypothetical protein